MRVQKTMRHSGAPSCRAHPAGFDAIKVRFTMVHARSFECASRNASRAKNPLGKGHDGKREDRHDAARTHVRLVCPHAINTKKSDHRCGFHSSSPEVVRPSQLRHQDRAIFFVKICLHHGFKSKKENTKFKNRP